MPPANAHSLGPVEDHEPIARFIFSRSHFAPAKREVKAAAFLPPDNLKTSVFRTQGMEADAVWELGRSVIGAARGTNPKARADLDVAAAQRVNSLRVEPETATHRRHANIVGWPHDESHRRLLAAELALVASLHMPADSPSASRGV